MTSRKTGVVRTPLKFLEFDNNSRLCTDDVVQDTHGMAVCLENTMAALAVLSNYPMARMRVVLVSDCNHGRLIYSGLETCLGQDCLAVEVSRIDGRRCLPDDFLFLVKSSVLPCSITPIEILRLAVHNVAILVVATLETKQASHVYVSVCMVLLASMGNTDYNRQLAEDFLRMWLYAELGSIGDPPEWGHQALQCLKKIDPWAAAFMLGLGEAASILVPLSLPAELSIVIDNAEWLRSHATLASCTTHGTA